MRLFYPFVCFCFRIVFVSFHRFKVYGSDFLPKGPCVVAPNHASYYDPPLIAISCKEEVHFLAKGELFEYPILKTMIEHLNAHPITGTAQDLSSFKLVFRLLKEQKKVVIFPEGVRTQNRQLSPIRSGIGLIALRAHCPIVPVYIHGTFDVWPPQNILPRLWGKIACVFGSPIYPENFSHFEKKTAQEEIAKKVQESIENLRYWYLEGAQGTPP